VTDAHRRAPRDARRAGLLYSDDARPGIRRVRRGGGFAYRGPRGRPVRDGATLARIRRLAVPPAWTDVWINPNPRGHVQATGRDARGRKQARYHPAWRAARDEAKFDRMPDFARALPRIRSRVRRDLAGGGPPTRPRVVAALVRLLEETLVRVGNDEYARHNGSYGLTTLRDRHVRKGGGELALRFLGKGGKPHDVAVGDPRVARIVVRCQDLPGERLFQYVDGDGRRRAVGSADVNAYLRDVSGRDFTAKDFRTWAGTLLALRHLRRAAGARSAAPTKRALVAALDAVAGRLRNTRAVCRSSYVHPAVVAAYEDGSLERRLARCARGGACPRGLRRDEALAYLFLREVASRGDGRQRRARSPVRIRTNSGAPDA
jgi:DNA topoisomerase-1